MTRKKDLKVLSELVEQSDVPYTTIILYLANEGLLEKYYSELELRKQYPLEPSITEAEFNRIVNGEKDSKTKQGNTRNTTQKKEEK